MADIVERYSTTIDIYSHRRQTPKLATTYMIFKLILLISNLILMIFGCALIGVGSYALNSTANDLVGHTLPSGLIVMGVFLLFLAAIGAISAWKESRLGLSIYLLFLLIITIILFSIGVAVVAKKSQAGMYIQEAWSAASDDLKNGVQVELDCCGLMFNGDAARMPCPTTNTTEPCYDKLVSAFNTAYSHAGGTGIAFSVVMGCGIGFVVCLMQGIKRKQAEAQAEKVRATNAGEFEQGELPPEDLDSIDAGAASMFDKHGFNPIVHDPNVAAQQQRRKK